MTSTVTGSEYLLHDPPTDGITNVVFANKSDLLAVTSWDKNVRLYNVRSNGLVWTSLGKHPVLDCCFSPDDLNVYSGGLEKVIVQHDSATGRKTSIGSHEQPVKCLQFSNQHNLLCSGSWDGSIALWDVKSDKPIVGSYVHEGTKIYTMSFAGNRLVVGTSGRHVHIYDLRNMSTPEQTRESSLMNQTRCIRCFVDHSGYALSSIEGRVAIEYFDTDATVQARKYAFKCHRKTVNGQQLLYPVNTMAFHPRYGTFVTGGCDGIVNVWDGENKKRICQYPAYPTSIAATAFNSNGQLLAIASSYTWEEGEKDHPADSISIRNVTENEVKPKARAITSSAPPAPPAPPTNK